MDGHIIEKESDIRKYLQEPWNRRSRRCGPGDQPWDNHMFDSFQSERVWGKLTRTGRPLARAYGRHDRDRRLFSDGLRQCRPAQEVPFQIAVASACND
jgi:hypothetical protein